MQKTNNKPSLLATAQAPSLVLMMTEMWWCFYSRCYGVFILQLLYPESQNISRMFFSIHVFDYRQEFGHVSQYLVNERKAVGLTLFVSRRFFFTVPFLTAILDSRQPTLIRCPNPEAMRTRVSKVQPLLYLTVVYIETLVQFN